MPTRIEKAAPTRQRQRLLLYFLEWSGRGLTRTELQKLLLLYTEETNSRHYAFVPYRYGGYSFQCERDLRQLEQVGWIAKQHQRRVLKNPIDGKLWAAASAERSAVKEWLATCRWRGNKLTAESYRRYPYYAIRSNITNSLPLNKSTRMKIDAAKPAPPDRGITVFTLGYESLHFEDWMNKLIKNSVAAVCDVRHNPWSRKYGFSRSQLKNILPGFGIEYTGFPELGVASSDRAELNTKAEYRALFEKYRHELPQHSMALERLQQVVEEKRRVVLTCFEAHHSDCHRHCISERLTGKQGYRVQHL